MKWRLLGSAMLPNWREMDGLAFGEAIAWRKYEKMHGYSYGYFWRNCSDGLDGTSHDYAGKHGTNCFLGWHAGLSDRSRADYRQWWNFPGQ